MTAGNTVMYATMKDNRTAQEFVELLPLKLKAFDRIGLVKSTVLPHSISEDGERTRKYALGSIFYWPEGPEVAFCYSDHLPKTVVDIIHIGMIESGVEHFRNYTGDILVELANEVPVQAEPEEQ
ncbi:cyclophilin-like fold protein [Sporomusa sp.]|uniref:cyclophilin-like fold protein n=1 Tax=Sporomusa sp. TaxID=2078658 RepID=UPI002B9EE10E|nr:cyclophilin-like fold protein [Sporomusa sp.]HWR42248.1 cyclophilin-like fold protein [Sporomusa sp.]